MSTIGKSMFTNKAYCCCDIARDMISTGGPSPIPLPPVITIDASVLDESAFNALEIIQTSYGLNMVNKTYEQIPTDYQQYVDLYVILTAIYEKMSNPKLALLIEIAKSTLVGAVNSYSNYADCMMLQLSKTNLQNQINDILSNKNQKMVEMATSAGQLSLVKSFTLAPVFNYYILVYGLPAFGVGFDPLKISFLVNVLVKAGINPYK